MTSVQNSETATGSTKRGSARASREGKGDSRKDSRTSKDHKEAPKGGRAPDDGSTNRKFEPKAKDSTPELAEGRSDTFADQTREAPPPESLPHPMDTEKLVGRLPDPAVDPEERTDDVDGSCAKYDEEDKTLSLSTALPTTTSKEVYRAGTEEVVQTPSASLNNYEVSTYASESTKSISTDTLTVCNEELYDSPTNGETVQSSPTNGESLQSSLREEGDMQNCMEEKGFAAIKEPHSPKNQDSTTQESNDTFDDLLGNCDNSQFYVDLDDFGTSLSPYKVDLKTLKRVGKQKKVDEYEEKIIERDPTRFFGHSACGIGNILQLDLAKLSRERRWIWLLARYEAFCLTLQVNGINLSKIRTGRAKGSRCQLIDYINKERARIFGNDTFFQTGETLMNIPPFVNFLRREELLFFGIAKTPYEVVSVDEFKPEPDSGEPYKVVHTIVLDGTESLREDMGLRFVMYFTFDNQENSEYVNAHVPLQKSWIHEVPIRIVRSYNSHSRYSPIWGYRYDGLYRIINVFSDNNHEGTRVWVYIFSACNTKLRPPRHKLTHDTILKFKIVKERSLRGILYKHTLTHYKIQRHINSRRADDIKHVDIIFKGKRLFTVGIPHFVKMKSKVPIPVNLAAIYYYIKQVRLTNKMNIWKAPQGE
ncbi:hypothetical protein BEWA_013700 [Theileria equi strain WA]|uniref:YDG domain-containing protein n=1 Tax=Theileria equi strain WA TaxID=1537102 RepID=L1LBV9_THEEQ|nr:hypothetical protein BEWA_013700 [Theileria equi strain WA]EKX72811.1 hypothetical protein BEWA_013700 [Theileria equi strain WA]|eukprot:XP_004832263.1 hypothetical protein BEWA_013700 [Theileria equi strain WA]